MRHSNSEAPSLVEEQVRAFIDERLPNCRALDDAKLECQQAICLAEALSSEDIHPSVWEAARKLNSLRNQIAHNLEPEGVVDRMNHISTLIGTAQAGFRIEGKTAEAAALANLVSRSVCFILSYLFCKASARTGSHTCSRRERR
jgi:hypothetical protein